MILWRSTWEVLDVMMARDVHTAHDWLKGVDGVVVDEVVNSPPKSGISTMEDGAISALARWTHIGRCS